MTKQKLRDMPLTLWLVVAGTILALYLRRAHLGIDTHPGESVTLSPGKGPPPVLPPVGAFHLPVVKLPTGGGGGGVATPYHYQDGSGGGGRVDTPFHYQDDSGGGGVVPQPQSEGP